MIVAETYTELMTNVPHLGFELTMEALTGLIVYPLFRRAKKRWHRELDDEHGVVHHKPVPRDTEVFVK